MPRTHERPLLRSPEYRTTRSRQLRSSERTERELVLSFVLLRSGTIYYSRTATSARISPLNTSDKLTGLAASSLLSKLGVDARTLSRSLLPTPGLASFIGLFSGTQIRPGTSASNHHTNSCPRPLPKGTKAATTSYSGPRMRPQKDWVLALLLSKSRPSRRGLLVKRRPQRDESPLPPVAVQGRERNLPILG